MFFKAWRGTSRRWQSKWTTLLCPQVIDLHLPHARIHNKAVQLSIVSFHRSIIQKEKTMVKLLTPAKLLLISFVLASLACSGLTGGGGTNRHNRNPPADQPASGSGSQVIRQWATSATASTEYAPDSWAAYQATGAPNVIECSDNEYAWASGPSDTLEWIELTFRDSGQSDGDQHSPELHSVAGRKSGGHFAGGVNPRWSGPALPN